MSDVRVEFDEGAIHALLNDRDGQVMRKLFARGKRIESTAKRLCPVDHGRLRSSITTQFYSSGAGTVIRVGTDVEYARFVHDGTGIYGPRGAVIRPRRSKVLVFQGSNGKTAFARYVRGSEGRPFMTRAMRETS